MNNGMTRRCGALIIQPSHEMTGKEERLVEFRLLEFEELQISSFIPLPMNKELLTSSFTSLLFIKFVLFFFSDPNPNPHSPPHSEITLHSSPASVPCVLFMCPLDFR